MAAADSEAGSSPVSPATRRWPGMTASTPAATAARNGGRSRVSTAARPSGTTANSACESSSVAPCPGKCLAHAATPAAWSPRTAAAPCLATSAGSAPNDRVPTTGLSGAASTSRQGARSRLMPSAARSAPIAACTRSVSVTSSTAPSAALPGYGLPVPYQTRVTSPPSSSVATSRSGATARSVAARSASASGPAAMFGAKSVTPASPRCRASRSHRGATVPGNGGMRMASTSRSSAVSPAVNPSPPRRAGPIAAVAVRRGRRS
jgi:hypothetical protein